MTNLKVRAQTSVPCLIGIGAENVCHWLRVVAMIGRPTWTTVSSTVALALAGAAAGGAAVPVEALGLPFGPYV